MFASESRVPLASVIEDLRQTLRAIEGKGRRRCEVLPFGIDALDSRLASSGLRLDALHEIAAASPSAGDDASATLFMAGVAARVQGSVLWVLRRRDLFAPALYQAGLSPDRLIYAEAADDSQLLAVMEDGLRHRGLGAVIGEVKRAATAMTRRLQLAAEGGHTITLLMRRHERDAVDPFAIPSAALTRWSVASAPSSPLLVAGIGRPRWRLACIRQRGGDPFELTVEASDETGRLALPAALVDRSGAEGGAASRVAA